jgi:hypothetical protein
MLTKFICLEVLRLVLDFLFEASFEDKYDEVDNVSKITLPACPEQGYGHHRLP